jgi:hypothetical protein
MAAFMVSWDWAAFDGADSAARGHSPSPEPAEELPNVADEEVGSIVGGPVTAAVKLAPGDDVGVITFGKLTCTPIT